MTEISCYSYLGFSRYIASPCYLDPRIHQCVYLGYYTKQRSPDGVIWFETYMVFLLKNYLSSCYQLVQHSIYSSRVSNAPTEIGKYFHGCCFHGILQSWFDVLGGKGSFRKTLGCSWESEDYLLTPLYGKGCEGHRSLLR